MFKVGDYVVLTRLLPFDSSLGLKVGRMIKISYKTVGGTYYGHINGVYNRYFLDPSQIISPKDLTKLEKLIYGVTNEK